MDPHCIHIDIFSSEYLAAEKNLNVALNKSTILYLKSDLTLNSDLWEEIQFIKISRAFVKLNIKFAGWWF